MDSHLQNPLNNLIVKYGFACLRDPHAEYQLGSKEMEVAHGWKWDDHDPIHELHCWTDSCENQTG